MNIVIDARWILAEISGIGLYTRSLVKHLAVTDRSNTYTILFDNPEVQEREVREAGLWRAANVRPKTVPWGPFSLKSQRELPAVLEELKTDVFHAPNFLIPFAAFRRRSRIACVVTIHDLIPLLFPEYTPRALKTRLHLIYRLAIRESVRRADIVIAPSTSTSQDILKTLLPADDDRVRVIPEAVDESFHPGPPEERHPRTILFVGRREPYKNLRVLVTAFADLLKRVPDARLRVIGPPDPRYPDAEQVAADLNIEGSIEWEGYVSGLDLVAAYQQSAVFALPSRYEGFGLPVLEAMACGTPVVCGNRSSLPEVAGKAAILVPPADASSLSHALEKVLTDPALAEDLSSRGLKHAATFSWERMAEATLDAYREAALRREAAGAV